MPGAEPVPFVEWYSNVLAYSGSPRPANPSNIGRYSNTPRGRRQFRFQADVDVAVRL